MPPLHPLHALVYLGDGAVLLPCAAVLFLWLIAVPPSRRIAWWWLAAVLLVGGGAALSKMAYMAWGWHPAGLDFIGLSGHAALSSLFFPSAAALLASRTQPGLRLVLVILAACLAGAISLSSWLLRDHSLAEVVLGALWGGLVAAVFLAITWRDDGQAALPPKWVIASLLVLVMVAYKDQFPSTRILSRIAARVDGTTVIHTRTDLGPQDQLSKTPPGPRQAARRSRTYP